MDWGSSLSPFGLAGLSETSVSSPPQMARRRRCWSLVGVHRSMRECLVRSDCFQEQQKSTFIPFPLKPMEEILFRINADHSRLFPIITSGERIGLDESWGCEGEGDEEWCVPQRISCLWKLLADQWAHLDEWWSLADEKEVTRSLLLHQRCISFVWWRSNHSFRTSSPRRVVLLMFISFRMKDWSLRLFLHPNEEVWKCLCIFPNSNRCHLAPRPISSLFETSTRLASAVRCQIQIVATLSITYRICSSSVDVLWPFVNGESRFLDAKHSLTRWSLGDWRAEMREDELRSHLRIVIGCRFT